MTDNEDDSDSDDDVGGTLRSWPGGNPLDDATIGKVAIKFPASAAHTLTSVASLSAEVFRPDQSEMVDCYLKALENKDKKTVFLLAENTLAPRQVGIETQLDPNITRALSKIVAADIENGETREHELELARIGARGPIWVKVVEYVAIAVGWLLATAFGLKLFGGAG